MAERSDGSSENDNVTTVDVPEIPTDPTSASLTGQSSLTTVSARDETTKSVRSLKALDTTGTSSTEKTGSTESMGALNDSERKYSRPSLYKSNSNPMRLGQSSERRQPLRRAYSIKEKISHETAKFFGVPTTSATPATTPDEQPSPDSPSQENKWKKRRFRHLNSVYGVKAKEVSNEMQNAETQPDSALHDNLSVRTAIPLEPERRESVAKMAYNAFSSLIQGDLFHKKRRRRISTLMEEPEPSTLVQTPYRCIRERNHLRNHRSFPFVNQIQSIEEQRAELAKMQSSFEEVIVDGQSKPVRSHKPVHRTDQPSEWTKQWRMPAFVNVVRETEETDEMEMADFAHHDEPRPSSSQSTQPPLATFHLPEPHQPNEIDEILTSHFVPPVDRLRGFPVEPDERGQETTKSLLHDHVTQQARTPGGSTHGKHKFGLSMVLQERENGKKFRQLIEESGRPQSKKLSFLPERFRPTAAHQRSLPIFGKFKRNTKVDPKHEFVKKQLEDEGDDYRPFFTYWVTTVQVIIMIFSLLYYGIGTDFTHGLGVIERSGDVLASSMSVQHIVIWEQNNIWVGPRFADLVHMGAKYTPCMRRDARIHEQIAEETALENKETGCCVGPDGCFQTSACPKQFATFYKSIVLGPNKTQPVVCGQDPRYCDTPKSVAPFDWGPNISEWPVCQRRTAVVPRREAHMHCEVMGRPCCIQMHGQCRITTREYCEFVRGYYHENAILCSQVSCLNDVCGMTPFLAKERPDQFYRFFIPLFIHAGIIRCVLTCLIQLTIMRRFEVMIGCFRLAIIYFVSGIGGYLASASFSPYMPEVGPAGSQGGVLGALIVNVIYNWNYIKNPKKALLEHFGLVGLLFLTGFLPYIDNWAQCFGFVFGSLMASALIPYISFGRGSRFIIVVFSLIITVVLFAFLLILFYGLPVIDSPLLTFLNCPFSGHVCDQQGLTLRSWLPI